MKSRPINILILCTANSARSILGEALIQRLGQGRFRAFSAGSQPRGIPNPTGLKLLESLGHDISGFRSKSWDEFAGTDAPQMDIVITVCDSAAGESCPLWPGAPVKAHWGIPDPAGKGETEEAQLGEVTCFLSHSWQDEEAVPGAKYKEFSRWAKTHEETTGKEPTLWLVRLPPLSSQLSLPLLRG